MHWWDNDTVTLWIIPVVIFFTRVVDVSMDTVRIISISKGYKILAAFIGFFEVLIWLFAITRIMQNLHNWVCYVAYAGGFATGNYVGIIIEEKLAMGFQMVRIITRHEPNDLIQALRDAGFGVTSVKGSGKNGEVGVIYVVVNRKLMYQVKDIIMKYNPQAFYTIEDVRAISKLSYMIENNQS
jgi:uncharacterized protein YebE (UPF0316 family)